MSDDIRFLSLSLGLDCYTSTTDEDDSFMIAMSTILLDDFSFELLVMFFTNSS